MHWLLYCLFVRGCSAPESEAFELPRKSSYVLQVLTYGVTLLLSLSYSQRIPYLINVTVADTIWQTRQTRILSLVQCAPLTCKVRAQFRFIIHIHTSLAQCCVFDTHPAVLSALAGHFELQTNISLAREACNCRNSWCKLCTVYCLTDLFRMSHIVYIKVHHSFLEGVSQRGAAAVVMSMALQLKESWSSLIACCAQSRVMFEVTHD